MKISHRKLCFYFILSVAALVFTTSCQNDLSNPFATSSAIRFRCDSVATRSAGLTGSGATAILQMGVYAAHSSTEWSNASTLNFMTNRLVARTSASDPWEYTPEAYWPSEGKISFFGYAPYDATISANNTAGVPLISDFAVKPNHADQIDLLVAVPLKDQTKSSSAAGYTTMILRHALSRISFGAKLIDASGDPVVITKLVLSNLYSQGDCPMDGTQRTWSIKGSDQGNASYTLTNQAGGGLQDKALTSDYEVISATDGNLFLLPQTLQATTTLAVNYSVGGVAATETITLNLAEALSDWQAGEALRLLITLDSNAPFDASLAYQHTDWENVSTDVSIESNAFLTVTDVEVSAYDAASTRVYFYTNQPADRVFIDPKGRVSTVAGTEFNVNDEFYGLTNQDSETAFTYDASTGKGYFDLINRNTANAGTVTNQGKMPLIVKLCAGSLHRYITVNPVVTTEAAKNNTTPYVGTFHRYNEMGERIVTWHVANDITWTATIEQSADHTELVIDRHASPDYRDNRLYSYSPRTAEGAKVDPLTTVTGKGRVYFRVGWKTPCLNETTVRYARIKMTYSGTGAPAEHYIYCRQGEEADLMNPSSNSDDLAVYNIMSDGVTVDYPSQGGMISNWGRPRLWPLIGEPAPGGYPTVDYSDALDPDVSICPERYGYPNQAVVDFIKQALQYLQPQWGYYADGYFDRRAISDDRVNNTSTEVASSGILFYYPSNNHSIFMPTSGYRGTDGKLMNIGKAGGYWSSENDTQDNTKAIGMLLYNGATANDVIGYNKRHAFFMRCVKIKNGVVISFNPNGGENEPRSVTGRAGVATYIPSRVPNNYVKDNYEFKGWTEDKAGTGTLYQPQGTISPDKDVTLYAQWELALPYIPIDFTQYLTQQQQTDYLASAGTSYSDYEIGNNGDKLSTELYDKFTTINEKAYPKLEFHKNLMTATDWTSAYNACKALTDKEAKWRLPRFMEVQLLSDISPIDALKEHSVLGGKNFFWTGTQSTHVAYGGAQTAYSRSLYSSGFSAYSITNNATYRCVRELPLQP